MFRKNQLDADMAEEMRAHLEFQTTENRKRGMGAEEARYAAQRSFGGVAQFQERARDERGWRWLEQLGQDLRYGARALRKSFGFTSVAVATLALGIGINTAIFTLFDAFVLRPPRVREPDRVVSLFGKFEKDKNVPPGAWAKTRAAIPYLDYTYYREHNAVFSGLAAAMLAPTTLGDPLGAGVAPGSDGAVAAPEEQQIFVQLVSGNYFEVLGGRATLGRTFLPEEDQVPGARPVVVLNHRFWLRHFAADPGIVGKTLSLNGQLFTIVGVAGPDFGGNRLTEPAAWVPIMMAADIVPGTKLTSTAGTYVDIVGRLRPDMNLTQAQAQMDVVAQQNQGANPNSKITGVRLALLTRDNNPDLTVWTLSLTLVGIVLLVIAANVANLSLARGVARYREIGVRLTLGASRGRLLRQLLTESALLGLLGGLFGGLLSIAATRVLVTLIQGEAQALPISFGVEANLSPDLRVLGYAFGLSLLTGLVVGLVPALQTTKLDLNSALKNEGTVFGRRVDHSRLRKLLVIAQVAFCLVLLVGAGLLARGLQAAQSVDLGFEPKHVLVVQEDLRSHGYNATRRAQFYRDLAERVRGLPGVTAVAWASDVPLQGGAETGPAGASEAAPSRQVGFNFVSPDFFSALGMPLVHGRNFNAQDATQPLPRAVVNEALARLLWPDADPVGRQLYGFFDEPAEVVGVVRNARDAQLWAANEPYMYFIDRPQVKGAGGSTSGNMAILIRTEREPHASIPAVREVVRTMDDKLWPKMRTLESNLSLQLFPSHVGVWLAAGLGLLALVVTAVGLYGVIAYTTNQRTREIGVRMALGARPADVVQLVLRQGWRLVGLGVVFGMIGAVALGRVLARFLYGVSPVDPVAFGGVSVFLGAVTLMACWLPARRATKVDPIVALRTE